MRVYLSENAFIDLLLSSAEVYNEKTMPWGENRDGTISGSVSEFFFKISAHFLNGAAYVKRAKIHCPFPPDF